MIYLGSFLGPRGH